MFKFLLQPNYFSKKTLVVISFVLIPFHDAYAAVAGPTLFDFFHFGTQAHTGVVIRLATILCLVYFLAGVYKYISAGGDAEKKQSGVKIIVHGLVGLFILVSVWAIVGLLVNTLVANPNITPVIK